MKKLYTEEEVKEIVYLEWQSNHLVNKYKNKDTITQREHNEIKNFRNQLLEKYSIFFEPEIEQFKNIERKLKENIPLGKIKCSTFSTGLFC